MTQIGIDKKRVKLIISLEMKIATIRDFVEKRIEEHKKMNKDQGAVSAYENVLELLKKDNREFLG